MKKTDRLQAARTAVSVANLAHWLLPAIAGAVLPAVTIGGILATSGGLFAGLLLAALVPTQPRKLRRWRVSRERGYRIAKLESVLDLRDPGQYEHKTRTTVVPTRPSPGIVIESRLWSGQGVPDEIEVVNGKAFGSTRRGQYEIHAIDLLHDLVLGRAHTYEVIQRYLSDADLAPFFIEALEPIVDVLKMRVLFPTGQMPAEDDIDAVGPRAELTYLRDAGCVELVICDPRVPERYGMQWKPVEKTIATPSAPGGAIEAGAILPRAPLPSFLPARYDATRREMWRLGGP